jgi:hypothetical protein
VALEIGVLPVLSLRLLLAVKQAYDMPVPRAFETPSDMVKLWRLGTAVLRERGDPCTPSIKIHSTISLRPFLPDSMT